MSELHSTSVSPADIRRRQIVFSAFWSIVLIAVLVAFRSVLVPFIVALLLAFVLSPIARRLERWKLGGRALPRWAAVLGIYFVMISGLAITISTTAPFIAGEVRDFLRDEVPRIRRDFHDRWLPRIRSINERFIAPTTGAVAGPDEQPETAVGTADHTLHVEPRDGGGYRVVLPADGLHVEPVGSRGAYRIVPVARQRRSARGETDALLDSVREIGAGHTEDLIRVGRGIVGSVIGGIFGFFITLMLSAYILYTESTILGFLRSLVAPHQRRAWDELLTRIDRGLSGVVRGQLVICAVNGVLSAIGFAIANLPYWPLMALIAAVFSIVPIFGSIVSSIPAVLLGLRNGFGTGIFVLAWIIGIHQLEANLLNPKIMGDAAKIHPVLVVFSLLAGEHFFGILGALLAVPAMSIAQSIFLHWRKYALSYGDPSISRDSLTSDSFSAVPAKIDPTE